MNWLIFLAGIIAGYWAIRAYIWVMARRAYHKELDRLYAQMVIYADLPQSERKHTRNAEALAYQRWDEHRWRGPPRLFK